MIGCIFIFLLSAIDGSCEICKITNNNDGPTVVATEITPRKDISDIAF